MLLLIQIALLTASLAGLITLFFQRSPRLAKWMGCLCIGISGLMAFFSGIRALQAETAFNYQLCSTFPNLIFCFKLDFLAGFFLALLGVIVILSAFYAPGYLRAYERHKAPVRMITFTGLFIASMYLVLLAADAVSFLFAWELMSLTSYFLVLYRHEHAANRSAAFIYLIMAQVSGILLLLAYALLYKFSADFAFVSLHAALLTPFWSSLAFLAAFLGFGMKAGLVPLHVWLPRAHPVAPAHISALMSGVMLKTAIYGLLRFIFNLPTPLIWQWGIIVLGFGAVTAFYGILAALMQTDFKKLLAYSSIENVGLIFVALGFMLFFQSRWHQSLALLCLIIIFFQCLTHAVCKSLLFLGAGAIIQHTHESDLEKMGGLIHKMPYTALFMLIGCVSIVALPPFAGFVAEWLLLQTALQATFFSSGILKLLSPLLVAVIALTAALAVSCFVKVYAIAFLGLPRSRRLRHARDPSFGMQLALGTLATLSLIFGLLPFFTINFFNSTHIFSVMVAFKPSSSLGALLKTSTYNPLFLIVGLLLVSGLTYFLVKILYKQRKVNQNVTVWDCGFGKLNSHMQYTATAFFMPFRRLFAGIFESREIVVTQEAGVLPPAGKIASEINYALEIKDKFWIYVYAPLERGITITARQVARLQSGNVRLYLAYTFCTLILLLWLVV